MLLFFFVLFLFSFFFSYFRSPVSLTLDFRVSVLLVRPPVRLLLNVTW